MNGRDPVTALQTAAAVRELDTANDPAAVLDWRLDPTNTHSTGTGPLPWARGLPHTLDDHPLAEELRARHRIVTNLAQQIRDDTHTWTPTTAPRWAHTLLQADPQLVADLAVWRASLQIPDHDQRPTGPPRYTTIEREHQKRLDNQLSNALKDRSALAVNKWAPVVQHLDPRITADPYWPSLAAKIEAADRVGIGIMKVLTDAANQRPLPDEMPAAALWSRVQHQRPTPDNALVDHPILNDDATTPLSTAPTMQAVTNALMLLTDEELDEHIGELQLQLALVDTDTFIFNPGVYQHEDPVPEDIVRQHRAAQDAIRNARHADQQLQAAIEATQATATELHNTRTELAATPRYRRGQRRQLQAHIDTLIVERNNRDRQHDSARAAARDAHSDAVLLAGPEQDWNHILTSHPDAIPPQPVTREETQDSADEEVRERITCIQLELNQFCAEQHRRSTLSPAQRAIENRLPQATVVPSENGFDIDESLDFFDPPFDADLGL
ncbi:hypothetical protein [Nocardia asiatica]|uniref:hypothetical protein n=1 Tax=Nocardia asiatica TaxID=209252 RepID=UPI003EE39153